jgi:hypothetical protein
MQRISNQKNHHLQSSHNAPNSQQPNQPERSENSRPEYFFKFTTICSEPRSSELGREIIAHFGPN